MPIIRERKAFGWGITTLHILNGRQSIDNHTCWWPPTMA
jgi:hypothetical protein